MKKFQYSLETVLTYKQQVLDNEKAEHAAILNRVRQKNEEIRLLKRDLMGFQKGFDESKSLGAPIEDFRLYDMCIGLVEDQITFQKEQLATLKKKRRRSRK